MRLKTYSNSQRAQGGKGLLSHENSVQDLHKFMAKILPRREKGGRTWREKRRAAGSFLLFCPAHSIQRGERSFCSRVKRHTCQLPPFLAFQVFF